MKSINPAKILLLIILFIGCKKSPVKYDSNEVQKRINTRETIYLYKEKPITGLVYEKNNLDLILKEFEVKEGKLSGSYREYYLNGNLKLENFFLKGELEGTSNSFYEDGSIKEKLYYSNGLIDGERNYFWPNGLLKESNHFENGIMTGENIYFYANGQIQKKFELDKFGKRKGIWEDYYSNGQLKERVEYEKGEGISDPIKYSKEGEIID